MSFKSSIEKLELSRLSIAPTTSCSESKIRNILFSLSVNLSETTESIVSIGHPESVRGERLSTEDFVKLSDLLS